jgi:pSer/pThr/pTyr-binding forkhead associated (FHA) protein
MPALIIYEPRRATRVFILRRTESLIGSGVLNDERLFSKGVETHHVSVVARGDGWWAVDRTGKGLTVNGAKVPEALLKDGDEIRAGEARLKFDAAYTHDGEATEAPRKAFGGTDILTKSGRRGGPDMVGMSI